eukprot:symbB.v1.2.031100.t1/scaffold3573.1/size55725/5
MPQSWFNLHGLSADQEPVALTLAEAIYGTFAALAGVLAKLMALLISYPLMRGKSLVQARNTGGGVRQVLSSVAKDEGMLSLYQAFRSGSENSPPEGFFEHCKDNQVDHSNKCNLSGEFEIPVDEQTSKLKVSLRSFEIPVVPAMDRFPSDLHENIGPDHVACNPFIDLSPSRMVQESAGNEPLHRRMARNPFTGFIQHSVCSTTSQIRRGRPIVIQPSQLSVGFAGTAPLLRRASRALAEERNREMTPETHPGGTESGASLVESVMAPCFAPLHLTWSEMKEQANFSEEMWR